MSALSKRQQARNEKALQELVQKVPGNNSCADCHARNPAWASWSLGVFLCMRCAAIHRKLGTHISKVKSLSMDSWTNEQVDNMRKVGNIMSNDIYNPEHRKPPVPVDADEADSAMERFIRAKYMNNVANGSSKPRSPAYDDNDTPPPLPPKNSKFGFRSASSIFPLSKSKKDAKMNKQHPPLPNSPPFSRSPPSRLHNKPSQVLGAAVDREHDDLEQKLIRLRDMGFNDNKRNIQVLKGVNGNLEQAVEALVRLQGDSRRPSPLPNSSSREPALRTSRSLTPITPTSGGLGLGAGLSVPSRSATDRPATPSSASTNPFDNLGPAQPQTAQSTGTLATKNPYSPTTNPFGAPAQQPATDAFSQAFENMSLSPVQPLFPNRTGGPASHPAQQQQPAYGQPMVPSAPTSPNSYNPMGFTSMTYPQPMQPQPTGYNPFLQNSSSPVNAQPPTQMPQNPMTVNTAQAQAQNAFNPFARSPTRIASPSLGQIPEQMQATMFTSQSGFQQAGAVYQSPSPMAQEPQTNPFFAQANPAPSTVQQPFGQQPYGQQPFGQQAPIQPQANANNPFGQALGQQPQGQYQLAQQQQPQQAYQPQRPDKASIMALYGNYSQPTQQSQQQNFTQQTPQPVQQIPTAQAVQPPSNPVNPVPQPAAQNAVSPTNPFMSNIAPASSTPDPFAARSRESMNLGMDLAWTNGRHSPDAFASLSARHG